MRSIELVLLLLAYTVLILTIFVSLICYKKHLEKWESIAFASSLLLLIVSLTLPLLFPELNEYHVIDLLLLISMVAVGLTTLLNVLSERIHNLPKQFKSILVFLSIGLSLISMVAYFTQAIAYIQYLIIGFLILMVAFSMILIRVTKPLKRIAHREKIERFFALIFLTVIPISLLTDYFLEQTGSQMAFGLTLPIAFILLAGSKLYDDLERLSLFKTNQHSVDHQLTQYTLTAREKDIVLLLINGKTYNEISKTLYISMPTVKTHASNVYKKCGVKTRHELASLLNR